MNNKKSYILKHKEELILSMIVVLIGVLFLVTYHIFGAKMDWINQHSVFPEYFRQLFYSNGELFPRFAASLGGGQNIYNFSYYGLFSPVIMISYLLPFVEMDEYIMISSLLLIMIGSILMYRWLLSHSFSKTNSFILALMYIFSAPIIYHSYVHVMFVNYMPFLILGFMGVDRYFKKNKSDLFIIAVFLMIMTSFYFSIGGIFALVIYGIYIYFKTKENVTIKSFLIDGIWFLVHILVSVAMSAILLYPTFKSLGGRGRSGGDGTSPLAYLIPKMDIYNLSFSAYGVGLSAIVILALVAGVFWKKREEKILGWMLLVVFAFPVFNYLLNGGLYLKGKVFIPFIPLLIYWIGYFVDNMEELKSKKIKLAGVFIGASVIAVLNVNIIDRRLMVICLSEIVSILVISLLVKNKLIILLAPLAVMIGTSVITHLDCNKMIDLEMYSEVKNEDIDALMSEIADSDYDSYRVEQHGIHSVNSANINRIHRVDQKITSIYSSSYNPIYMDFQKDIYGLENGYRNCLMQGVSYNPLYIDLMGVRYIISSKSEKGLTKLDTIGDVSLYENEDALPIAYVSHSLACDMAYDKLGFPYNQLALHTYTVASGDGLSNSGKKIDYVNDKVEIVAAIDENLNKVKISLPEMDTDDIKIEKVDGGYLIDAKVDTSVNIPIKKSEYKRVIFIEHHIENNSNDKDAAISIGGIYNKLTVSSHEYYNGNEDFQYTFILNKQKDYIPAYFKVGKYFISDLKAYGIRYKTIKETSVGYETVTMDENSNADVLSCNVDIMEDGYFVTSIPYDENFVVLLDGQEIPYEKINKAFVGFEITKGSHQVVINYKPEGYVLGGIVSGFGIITFILLIIGERIKNNSTKSNKKQKI